MVLTMSRSNENGAKNRGYIFIPREKIVRTCMQKDMMT
jgi:hypothetical protein